MLRLENVATPPTAATGVVPESTPPGGLLAIAIEMLPPKPGAVLPKLSCAVTRTAGEMTSPAIVAVGWTVKARRVAAPAAMLKAALVSGARPDAVAANRYPTPLLSMLSVENVATPALVATVFVPASVPPPGLTAIATVTLELKLVTVLPKASCAATRTAGVMVAPAAMLLGCTVKPSRVAGPGLMVKAALMAPASPEAVAVSV